MAIGHKIQSIRESKGFTQKDLASLVEVSTGVIAEWEADESTPNLAELSRLSKALSVSSDILLDAATEAEAPSTPAPAAPTDPVIENKSSTLTGVLVVLGILILGALAVAAVLLFDGKAQDPISPTETLTMSTSSTAPTKPLTSSQNTTATKIADPTEAPTAPTKPLSSSQNTTATKITRPTEPQTIPTTPTVPPKPLTFSEDTTAIEIADASVVTLLCYNYDGELAATGSGFVAFDSKTVITNYHVMSSAYTCKISTNQDISYKVSKILAYSKEQDIAIIQLSEDTGLNPLTLGNSKDIKKGEPVVAIGSPLGIKNTVSTGVLSGRLMEDNMDVLQFTAPISSGSSGGALFDNRGNVIGITYASYKNGQNLNLAIPIELAVNLKNATKVAVGDVSAIYREEHPYLEYLELHNSTPVVTLSELKSRPEKYDEKVVILVTYVSSYYWDTETGTYHHFYLSEQNDVSYNYDYDHNMHWKMDIDFEEMSSIQCILNIECPQPDEIIREGDKVIIIGSFHHTAKGEKYQYSEGYATYSDAFMNAYYVYVGS